MAALVGQSALAAPYFGMVDNGDGAITLQVIVDSPGSIAVEVAIEMTGGFQLTDVSIADTIAFDTPNPGDNPFVSGSPIQGDAFGLEFDTTNNWVFAAYGGPGGPGTYDFVTFGVSGAGTGIDASGYVAQNGSLGDLISDSFHVDPLWPGDTDHDGDVDAVDLTTLSQNWDPFGSAATFETGDFDADGDVDAADLATLSQNWAPFATSSAPNPDDWNDDGDVDATDLATLSQNWDPYGSGHTFQTGDWDCDGDVDPIDLAILSLNWDPFGLGLSTTAAPEPAAGALLSMLTFGGCTCARRRGSAPMPASSP